MWEIKLFGATAVTTERGTVVSGDFGGAKPRQILEILALSAGTPVSKEHLADLLWDGRPPRSYLGTLESYVCVLRRILGDRGRSSAVRTVTHGYVLDQDSVRVDLADFRRLVRSANDPAVAPAAGLARLEEAVALARGELLAGEAYAAWAMRERDVFRTELVAAASSAAARALAVGDPDTAVRMARTAVANDSLGEQGWRLLMQALRSTGRRSEALRAYFELRDHLLDELGTGPSPESTGLYLDILREENAGPGGVTLDAREEIRVLMRLLRQAVASVPGLQEPRSDRALAEVAAGLAAAS